MLIEELKNIVGDRGWTDDPDELAPHLEEWRGEAHGATPLKVAPASTAETAEIVKACSRHEAAIVPQGGNTGLCGGAIPDTSGDQILLSMARMNTVRAVNPEDFSIIVDAGCILADIQDAAVEAGRFFPLSLGAEGSCQIGGNLSTDAGGINVLRYGTARAQVLGLEVVLADGTVVDGLRTLRKDTAGYDMKQLFIGSEGTLGIITAAALKLYPDPGETTTILAAVESADKAVALLGLFRDRLGDRIQAFELISDRCMRFVERHIPDTALPFDARSEWYVLSELTVGQSMEGVETTLQVAFEDELVSDAIIAKNDTESERLWRMRHSISEAQKPEGAGLKHDISVPIGRIAEFLAAGDELLASAMPAARLVAFGHVGDGNLHYDVAPPSGGDDGAFAREGLALTESIYELVASMGGSFSAEHGVGVFKKAYLEKYRGGAELELMRSMKQVLDPRNTLNPGKVI